MAGFCATPSADLGLVQGLLTSVDCNVQTMSELGYRAVSGPNSQVGLALTALLTIYVAVLGLRLLMGLAPLRGGDLTFSLVKIGLVLALATSWPTYQHLVFDTLFRGPEQLAASMMGAIQPSGSALRGNPFDGLQATYDALQVGASNFAKGGAAASPFTGGAPFAAFALNSSAYLMMLTTLGVVLAAKIVLALLLALGPVFVAFLLFDATRGVFEGWLRASLAFAFMPLFATLALVVQLVLIEPHLLALAQLRQFDANALPIATAIFLLTLIAAAVSAAGVVGVAIIALGFKLPWRPATATLSGRDGAAVAAVAPTYATHAPAAQAQALAQPRAASVAAAVAAMDRRDSRDPTGASSRRISDAVGNPVLSDGPGRTPLGQTHRRSAQPRRAASSARRDR